jgi:hypothetical protein
MLDFSSDAATDETNAKSNSIIVNNREVITPIPPRNCLKQMINKKLSGQLMANI